MAFSFIVVARQYSAGGLMDFSNERVARARTLCGSSHDWNTGRYGPDVCHHLRCTPFVQSVS